MGRRLKRPIFSRGRCCILELPPEHNLLGHNKSGHNIYCVQIYLNTTNNLLGHNIWEKEEKDDDFYHYVVGQCHDKKVMNSTGQMTLVIIGDHDHNNIGDY